MFKSSFFLRGDGKKFGQSLFTVSPESLILSNHGDIAIMTPVLRGMLLCSSWKQLSIIMSFWLSNVPVFADQTKQVTYTPPELSIHNVSPSDGAIEKVGFRDCGEYVVSFCPLPYFWSLKRARFNHLCLVGLFILQMYVYSLGMTLYFAAEYLSIPNPSKVIRDVGQFFKEWPLLTWKSYLQCSWLIWVYLWVNFCYQCVKRWQEHVIH